MVTTTATTPEAYLASLPDDRRDAIALVRDTINAHLPPGFVEGMSHGMLGWAVPLDRFDDTYNGEPLGLERWFRERWAATGRKLDMGKSCVRFRSVDDLPLDVIGEVIARTDVDTYVERYREVRGSSAKSRSAGTG
jgi:hypothetical protein